MSGATYLVIDSIVPACGGADPTKPEAASRYAAALEFIGLPALSLGHVTKADALTYPFGSVFFHNLARVTWSLQRKGDASILTPRKANNYLLPGRFSVTTAWRDGIPREVRERPYSAALADRIAEIIGQPSTVSEIVDALNEGDEQLVHVKPDSVRAALRRGAKSDLFMEEGDRWRLR